MFDVVQVRSGARVVTDSSRDDRLTAFGKATLSDRYLLPGETYQDMFARVTAVAVDNVSGVQALSREFMTYYGKAGWHAVNIGSAPFLLVATVATLWLVLRRRRRPRRRRCPPRPRA